MMRIIVLILLVVSSYYTFGKEYYVGGTGASDNNPGTTTQPFATIRKAASVAVAGDIINIRSGTYRETIVPANSGTAANPIIYRADNGARAIISGLEPISETGWTLHNGNIYKKTITLPISGYGETITSTTSLLANQVFKNGEMMIEARWPKITGEDDLFDQYKYRHQRFGTNLMTGNYGTGYHSNSITDEALGSLPNLTGGKVFLNGWYTSGFRTINAHSGSNITFNAYYGEDQNSVNFRKWWFVTGKLALLTDEKEWHYESGTLYFRQPGGGSPTGVEYKARNWAFDLRNKSGITIAGLNFVGCEVATGDTNTNSITIDNVRAKYTNHAYPASGSFFWYTHQLQTGLRLIGSNNLVKNSEFDTGASHCIWIGPNGRVTNNQITRYSYEGNYGAGVAVWGPSPVEVDHNTMFHMGRSGVDFSTTSAGGSSRNIDIHHNDFYDYGLITHDMGAVYTAQNMNTTGTVVHHNWIHDSGTGGLGAKPDPQGIRIQGIFAGIYWDQGTGPATHHHNVLWNLWEDMPTAQDGADFYIQSVEGPRQNTPSSHLYNNTFYSNPAWNYHVSYVTWYNPPLDVQRNNIYRHGIRVRQEGDTPDVANSVLTGTNPVFVGNGSGGGLDFRLQAGSPAKDRGVHIPGITDGYLGAAPDAGAYEYGDPNPWIPGYTPVATTTVSNIPPAVKVTSPANNASFAAGTPITFSANASDADGTVTKVEFFCGTTKVGEDLSSPYSIVWNNPPIGTNPLTAKATDNQNRVTTSSPVTITVNGNAAPATSITGPSNNAQFTVGIPITITATASDANGSVTKVEFFNGTTKLGEDLTSPYNFVWNNAPVGTLALTVKATDNENSATTSTIVTIKVNANTPPTVAITGPSNNAQFITGASVTITATASDANGSVTKVEFFNGTTKLGEDLTSPYSFVWNNAPTGTHALTAKATDNESNATASAIITIIVNANTPPTVAITGPSNNSQFVIGTPVTIAATASDQNGSVSKVEFFNGTIKLGEDLTAPYSFVWKNAPAGKYAITAKATDNLNTIATSNPATITIMVNTPPTVTITGPSDNAQFAAGAAITIAATASDANGSVTKVEFFNGTAKLGEDPTSPYGFLWNNAPVGDYSITAKATDNLGAVATSSAVSIRVIAANTPPVVSITSPSNNASFLAGSSVTIKASASDANGAVSKVEFFSGSTKLGEDLTTPYSFVWKNVPEGNYSIKAKATDNLNAVTSSKSVSISIVSPISPTAFAGPDETLLLPENEITLNGSGTAAYGSSVSFQWAQLSGPDVAMLSNTALSEITLTNLIAGVYEFELTVTDQNGLTGKDQMQISVIAEEIAVSEIPRYFSPNDDGINDFWEWPQSEVFDNSLLMIFNRFGQQIYEAISYKNNWDGKMNGKALQEDAYYYVIRLLNNTDIKGAVRIIR